MKTLFLSGAVIAILGLAIAPMSGQTQSTSTTYVQTSKLVGVKVKSSQGEEIGVIKDVVLDRNTGCMAYTVLSTGGTGARVSTGGKMVAVPWAVYSPTSDLSELTVTVDRQRIYNAPVFDYARIEEYSRPDYITNVYSYYGVSPGAAVGVGVSGSTTTTGTTTTGAAATTNSSETTSPAATASPVATAPPAHKRVPAATATPRGKASPSPHATVPARPHVSESPGPHDAASASPSSRRARSRPTPSSGGRSETTREDESSQSEAAESPSEGKKSTRPRKTERSSESEPGATPESPEEQE
jgi:sporulation protein YlmC with PRC-barrel domain